MHHCSPARYCSNQPSMKSETLPWKVMRRIRLLTVESQEQEATHLTEKVHEIQRLSSLNLKVGLGDQVATKGHINWEIVLKDIENLRTKLSIFCAQEGIDVTRSEELHISLFASERQAMTGYPKLTFRTNIRLRIKVNPPWLTKS